MVYSIPIISKRALLTAVALLVMVFCPAVKSGGQAHGKKAPAAAAVKNDLADQISGMYSFLREGEFVQITVEDGKVSGFVSRYGDRDSDRGAFLDQFFSKATLEGNKITFATKPVHGTWFEFAGVISRGEAKTPDKDGYWNIKGTLKQYDEDESKHVAAKSRELILKSFPQDLEENQHPD
jgi:hypothetical protein